MADSHAPEVEQGVREAVRQWVPRGPGSVGVGTGHEYDDVVLRLIRWVHGTAHRRELTPVLRSTRREAGLDAQPDQDAALVAVLLRLRVLANAAGSSSSGPGRTELGRALVRHVTVLAEGRAEVLVVPGGAPPNFPLNYEETILVTGIGTHSVVSLGVEDENTVWLSIDGDHADEVFCRPADAEDLAARVIGWATTAPRPPLGDRVRALVGRALGLDLH